MCFFLFTLARSNRLIRCCLAQQNSRCVYLVQLLHRLKQVIFEARGCFPSVKYFVSEQTQLPPLMKLPASQLPRITTAGLWDAVTQETSLLNFKIQKALGSTDIQAWIDYWSHSLIFLAPTGSFPEEPSAASWNVWRNFVLVHLSDCGPTLDQDDVQQQLETPT